ncbi:MAG: family 20 glycosylhydrolase, partial [Oscillospiraceae bacterium]|nr:family 20 glycosylhydrolase [Oscillospiraceae bacterium]
KVESVKKYLEYMALHGLNMVMLYTEDTYEVEGYPYFGYQRGRYSLSEIREIDDYAAELGIEVIPCIQTLGHLSKFLRYGVNNHIKEHDAVLLPGEEETYALISECIKTCRNAFRSKRIHIGCDETYGLGMGKTYARDGSRNKLETFKMFNDHLSRVVDICEEYNFRPMMWSDMYFSLFAPGRSEDYGLEIEVPQHAIDAVPDVDLVFWDYYHDYNKFYSVNLEKHMKFDKHILFAGGIWTWNGFVPNFRYTYDTVKPALEECLNFGVREVFGTSWAYGDINHHQALPCLAMYSEYCWRGKECTKDDVYSVSEFITKVPFELSETISDFFCGLEGDYNWGKLILWSDPLINLLCYDIDIKKADEIYKNALKNFENYKNVKDIEYYQALFTALVDKCMIHLNLREKYKANDREWLRNFANDIIPQFASDFERLYNLHEELWHRDLKTNGFEKLAVRYAGAIERIRYTGKVINRYLDGKTDVIEALETELIRGEKQKYLQPDQVMYTY